MKSLLEIGKVTFSELLRDKFVYVSFLVAIFLIFLSLAMGGLTNFEKMRVLLHFGFLSIEITLLGLAVLLGSSVIPKEIERQTCLLVLVRPLSRTSFIIGKWLGLFFLLLMTWLILLLLLAALLRFDFPFSTFLLAATGILIQSCLVLTISILASFLFRPVIAVFFGMSIYLIGNSMDQLKFLAQKSEDLIMQTWVNLFSYIVPQLYRINWRSHQFVMKGEIPSDVLMVVTHCVGWMLIYLVFSNLVFRRKDLV